MSLTTADLGSDLDRYDIRAFEVPTLDRSGEACTYCQTEGKTVQVQAYATDTNGEPLFLDSCGECLPNALELESVDPLEPVTLEFRR